MDEGRNEGKRKEGTNEYKNLHNKTVAGSRETILIEVWLLHCGVEMQSKTSDLVCKYVVSITGCFYSGWFVSEGLL